MGKTKYKELRGSQILRQNLVLATLSRTPVRIHDIRPNTISPGLRPYEKSLLDLLEKICDDCFIDINETGTQFFFFHSVLLSFSCFIILLMRLLLLFVQVQSWSISLGLWWVGKIWSMIVVLLAPLAISLSH